MEVSAQLHALAVLPPGKRAGTTRWEGQKSLPCRESNPRRPHP